MPGRRPEILSGARPVREWATALEEKGIRISARTIAKRAVENGVGFRIGQTLWLTPRQLDKALKAWKVKPAGRRAPAVAPPPGAAYQKALQLLAKKKGR